MSRCAICHTLIEAEDPVEECPECHQRYHAVCWSELGGCAIFGCSQAVQGEKPPAQAVVGGGWGDTKTCPSCGNEIGSSLLVCGCGARFPWADPMSVETYESWLYEKQELKRIHQRLVILFLVTLLGLTAPISGFLAGSYAHRNRHRLAGSEGTYLALGYGTAALGAAWLMVELLLALGL